MKLRNIEVRGRGRVGSEARGLKRVQEIRCRLPCLVNNVVSGKTHPLRRPTPTPTSEVNPSADPRRPIGDPTPVTVHLYRIWVHTTFVIRIPYVSPMYHHACDLACIVSMYLDVRPVLYLYYAICAMPPYYACVRNTNTAFELPAQTRCLEPGRGPRAPC